LKVTRKALKQSGAALEQAIRRDMSGCIAQELDRVVFLGAGSGGEPLGIIPGIATYGVNATDVSAAASWAAFRDAIVAFLTASAATSPDQARLLLRPEVWSKLDATLITGTAVSEWDRLKANLSNVLMSTNALAAPTGSPAESDAVLTVSLQGVPPIFVGAWGAVDVIRDPYSDAASGGLRLTGLATLDVTVARGVQIEVLQGVQS
jgi:hypothetical protein